MLASCKQIVFMLARTMFAFKHAASKELGDVLAMCLTRIFSMRRGKFLVLLVSAIILPFIFSTRITCLLNIKCLDIA